MCIRDRLISRIRQLHELGVTYTWRTLTHQIFYNCMPVMRPFKQLHEMRCSIAHSLEWASVAHLVIASAQSAAVVAHCLSTPELDGNLEGMLPHCVRRGRQRGEDICRKQRWTRGPRLKSKYSTMWNRKIHEKNAGVKIFTVQTLFLEIYAKKQQKKLMRLPYFLQYVTTFRDTFIQIRTPRLNFECPK